ncbi:hypothetical protein [Pseudofrankia sp. BMG5.37]|nr:hypothetical protein [Pseudofrankia sp. BMG5.37]MDT3442194.1 hypothetical protein [Pseudofrankia sp. BMG5.37]
MAITAASRAATSFFHPFQGDDPDGVVDLELDMFELHAFLR